MLLLVTYFNVFSFLCFMVKYAVTRYCCILLGYDGGCGAVLFNMLKQEIAWVIVQIQFPPHQTFYIYYINQSVNVVGGIIVISLGVVCNTLFEAKD